MKKTVGRLKAFTLVELIVVMVILAILASLLIPSLIKYIDKSRQVAVIAEAREVYTATQATVSELYGKSKTFTDGAKYYFPGDKTWRGFISGYALIRSQHYEPLKNGATEGYNNSVDGRVAVQILKYLDSYDESGDESSYRYVFPKLSSPKGYNPTGQTLNNFLKSKSDMPIGLLVGYTKAGKVDFVQYGRDNVLVTIWDGNIIVEDGDAKFFNYNSSVDSTGKRSNAGSPPSVDFEKRLAAQ